MFRITPIVKNILLINLGIFLVQSFFSIRLSEFFGLRVFFSDEFGFHQFLTYMWIHGDFRHIFGNMLMVLFLAPMLERVWGSKRFLTFLLKSKFYDATPKPSKTSIGYCFFDDVTLKKKLHDGIRLPRR